MLIPHGEEFQKQVLLFVADDDTDLRDYVIKIAAIPQLDAELELKLCKLISKTNSARPDTGSSEHCAETEYERAVEQIREANLRTPLWQALRYQNRGLTLTELVEVANLGLQKALRNFDYRQGHLFEQYSIWFIRRELINKIHLEKGEAPAKLANPSLVASIHLELTQDPELVAIMASLSPRERDVLNLRFGLQDDQSHTLDEVAQLFGVTRERIRQIEVKALRKIREGNRQRDSDHPRSANLAARRAVGKFRTALHLLEVSEAKLLNFKWGFTDGRIHTAAEVAHHFSVTVDAVNELELRALRSIPTSENHD